MEGLLYDFQAASSRCPKALSIIQIFANQNIELLMWRCLLYLSSIWDIWCHIHNSCTQSWLQVSNLSYLFDVTSRQMEKRRCNTATCATQRLENFLVWSSQQQPWHHFLTYQGGIQYIRQEEYSWDFKERTTELLTPFRGQCTSQFLLYKYSSDLL